METRLKSLKNTLAKLEATAKIQKEEIDKKQDLKGNQKILIDHDEAGEGIFEIIEHTEGEDEVG
jgi:hemerythrin superfamily protein